jgi:hypothetical protein
MRKFLFLFLLITTLTASTSPITSYSFRLNPISHEDWKTHTENGFQIQYPSEWELSLAKQMGSSFILFSPLENKEDLFRENVNLIIQDVKGMNIDLEKYAQISESQIKRMMTNSQILESKVLEKNGRSLYHLVYTADMGVYHLKFMQNYFIQNEKAYVLTFTADQKTYDRYIKVGEEILNTFDLLH